MTVIISPTLVIPNASGADIADGRNPIIGYKNIITTGNLVTTTQDASYPTINLANVFTNLKWKGTSVIANEFVTILNGEVADLDYIAIAKHNLGSAEIQVSVEYLASVGPDVWTELIPAALLVDDGPALWRFPKLAYLGLRLKMLPGLAPPSLGVIMCGELLVVQRRIFVGHAPVTYNVQTKVANGKSENGEFLGRIVLSEMSRTAASLKDLTGQWVRTELSPFLIYARANPFFFAWRPSEYPEEVGFCWLTNDPAPANTRPTVRMQVTLEMSGVT